MTIRSSVFVGTPDTAAYAHSWRSPAHPTPGGMPWGINLRTGEILWIDPWLLQQLREVGSLVLQGLGLKNYGKTSFGKILAMRLPVLAAGRSSMRILINDRKPEDGVGEYALLSEWYECVVVELRNARINMFDRSMGLTQAQLLQIAVEACQTASQRLLVDYEPLALQVAMFRMMQATEKAASVPLLEKWLRKLSMADLDAYYASSDNELQRSLDEMYDAMTPQEARELKASLQLLDNRPDTLNDRKFLYDASQVAGIFNRILYGDFGGIIGGTGSLRDSLTQQAVTIDWTGVPDNAVTLLRQLINRWQINALVNQDWELIHNIEIDDEEHEALKNVMYAQTKAERIRKIRAFPMMLMSFSQFYSDYLRVGDEGSAQRGLATGMLLGVDIFVLGRQPIEQIPVLMEHLGISYLDALQLTKLEVGCYGLKIRGRDMIFFQMVITEEERRVIASNKATDRMLDRIPVWMHGNTQFVSVAGQAIPISAYGGQVP